MANRTVKDATSIKGTNPQYLVEKIIRSRIYESKYWKEECFALSAELLVDKALNIRFIGGVYGGNIKPCPFICLILKMLQIQPEKDIVVEFISQQEYKYVRALGAVYMRLTGTSVDCYKYLEPLYLDYRKLRRMNKGGEFELVHMDEFIDELLREERACDVILPRIQKRQILEDTNDLGPRDNFLEDDMDAEESSDEEEEKAKEKSPSPVKDRKSHKEHEKVRRSLTPPRRRTPPPTQAPPSRNRRSRSRERPSAAHRVDRARSPRDRSDKHKKDSRSDKRHHETDDRHHRHKKSRK